MTLSRRTLMGTIAATMLPAAPMAARSTARPNILWLVSEDNNPFIGAYGDRLARTPNIDALAGRGVLFRNVYSNAPVCAPSRFAILTGAYPETCGPAHHMRAVAKLPAALRTYPELLRAGGYHCTNNAKTDYNCDVDPARIWNASGPDAHWRGRPAGVPFMAVFNDETTHESQLFQPTPGAVRPEQVRIPGYLPDTPEIRGDYASYYNLMEKMDANVGARLAELAADGLAENTIVFYYSDNGGVLPRSKRYCYDEGLRTALIAYFPPKWRHLAPAPPGGIVDAPVSFVDLAPTLLSLAGLPRASGMQGRAFLGGDAQPGTGLVFGMRNRMDERYDIVRTVTDGRWRYIRNYMPHRIWGMHGDYEWQARGYQSWDRARMQGTLTPAQRRFFETKPFEELYDLSADPDQLHDLAADPAQRSRMAALRRALDRHMLAVRDNGFIPEGGAAEGYHASRDERRYPLKRIMVLAQAAARGDPRKRALFERRLRDQDETIRYWAATGLLILGADAALARAALASAAERDPSTAVRIAAAEALCHIGDAPRGVAVLAAIAEARLPFAPRVLALNALDSIGEAARPAIPTLRRLYDDPNEYVVRAGRYLLAVLEGSYRPERSYGRGAGKA